jgi:hypothetical protein
MEREEGERWQGPGPSAAMTLDSASASIVELRRLGSDLKYQYGMRKRRKEWHQNIHERAKEGA